MSARQKTTLWAGLAEDNTRYVMRHWRICISYFCLAASLFLTAACDKAIEPEDKPDTIPPDTIPPASIFTQSARYIKGEIIVRWAKSVDDDFYSYTVERSETPDTSGLVQLSEITNRDTNFYWDKNIEKEMRYYYRIVTIDSAGNTTYSNIVMGSSFASLSFYINALDKYFTIDMDGGYLDTILTVDRSGYEWSPEYDRIAFDAGMKVLIGDYSYRIGWDIPESISSPFPEFNAESFFWSKASNRIFFYDRKESYWMNLEGGERVDIPMEEGFEYLDLNVCKATDYMACIKYGVPDIRHLRILTPEGDVLFDLPQNNLLSQRNPEWSPDGTQLIFLAYEETSQATNIYLINSDGTGLRNITNYTHAHVDEWNHHHVWSRGGTYFYYHMKDNDHIIIRNIIDGTEYDLTVMYPLAKPPLWLNDSTMIFFNGYDHPEIIMTNSDISNPQVIYTFAGDLTNPSDLEFVPN